MYADDIGPRLCIFKRNYTQAYAVAISETVLTSLEIE